jgi:hypothetical protein
MKHTTDKLNHVRNMPPLSHWPDQSRSFSIFNSEVVEWLCRDEAVMQWLFGMMQGRKLIKFDKSIGKWKGAAK